MVDSRNFIAQNGNGSYYWTEPTRSGDEAYRGIPSVAVYDKYFFRWDTARYRSPSYIAGRTGSAWN